jgi:hypothetical protein
MRDEVTLGILQLAPVGEILRQVNFFDGPERCFSLQSVKDDAIDVSRNPRAISPLPDFPSLCFCFPLCCVRKHLFTLFTTGALNPDVRHIEMRSQRFGSPCRQNYVAEHVETCFSFVNCRPFMYRMFDDGFGE